MAPRTELKLDLLPADVLGHILEYLGPASLHRIEETNKRLRQTVVEQRLWRRQCFKGCTNLRHVALEVRCQVVSGELAARGCAPLSVQHARSALFKRLCWRLGTPPNPHVNLATGLSLAEPCASATPTPAAGRGVAAAEAEGGLAGVAIAAAQQAGLAPQAAAGGQGQPHAAEQQQEQQRQPGQQQQQEEEEQHQEQAEQHEEDATVGSLGAAAVAQDPSALCFWSSASGSRSPSSSVRLDVGLRAPLVLLHELAVQPARGSRQILYPPCAVRLRVCYCPCEEPTSPASGPALSAAAASAAAASTAALRGAGVWQGRGLEQTCDIAEGTAARQGGALGTGITSSSDDESSAPDSCQCRQLGEWRGLPASTYRHWVGSALPLAPCAEMQRFTLPPTLCVGGNARLDLVGRAARSPEDGLYYVGVGIRVVGVPVPDFRVEMRGHSSVHDGGGPCTGAHSSRPVLVFTGTPARE